MLCCVGLEEDVRFHEMQADCAMLICQYAKSAVSRSGSKIFVSVVCSGISSCNHHVSVRVWPEFHEEAYVIIGRNERTRGRRCLAICLIVGDDVDMSG